MVVIFLLPAKPFAKTTTMSLVLMQPSTVMQLNVGSTASLSAAFKSGALMAASVIMYASIVAMLGWIMPEPLAQPPSVIFFPLMETCTAISLTAKSVVKIAIAALCPCWVFFPSPPTSAGAAFSIFVYGNGLPIIPVEATTTAVSLMPNNLAMSLVV